MPYQIRKKGNKWLVQNKDTKQSKGSHKTYSSALSQFRLLQGIKRGWEPTEKKNKKLAGWVSPGTKRTLPPPGIEEAHQSFKKGGKPRMMDYPEFEKSWKFREVLPEFPIPKYDIKEMYEPYKEWFKTKGRPERYNRGSFA